MAEVHAQNGVARFQQCEEDSGVCLRAGMRLHVGVIGTKERLGALDSECFHDVNMLATAVVALARITLGVLVGQATALRFHYARTGVILGSD